MQLTSGVVNLTGMLVYNTTATLGTVGIYFWNGATWVKANLPTTLPGDSGKFLMSNGSTWVLSNQTLKPAITNLSLAYHGYGVASWQKIIDTVITVSVPANSYISIPFPGVSSWSHCAFAGIAMIKPSDGALLVWHPLGQAIASLTLLLRCYQPSI